MKSFKKIIVAIAASLVCGVAFAATGTMNGWTLITKAHNFSLYFKDYSARLTPGYYTQIETGIFEGIENGTKVIFNKENVNLSSCKRGYGRLYITTMSQAPLAAYEVVYGGASVAAETFTFLCFIGEKQLKQYNPGTLRFSNPGGKMYRHCNIDGVKQFCLRK